MYEHQQVSRVLRIACTLGERRISRMTTGFLTRVPRWVKGDSCPTDFVYKGSQCLEWSMFYEIRKQVSVSDSITGAGRRSNVHM